MITDNMSYSEIANEFKSDWSNYLSDRIPEIMENPKYRKFVLKNVKDEQECYFKPVDIKVNGNNYILQISTVGRSEFKKKGFRFRIYMYYTRKDGTYAIEQCCNDIKNLLYLYIYPPHIFEEFRKDILKDTSLSIMETIHEFFQERSESNKWIFVGSNRYAVWSSSSVTLGKKLADDLHLHETYINFDTLEEQQMDIQGLRDFVLNHCLKDD